MDRAARTRLDVRGELQAEIMSAIWELGEATVEEVRRALPRGRQRAYTTLQTVMNRLVERGLLDRERRGRGYVYRARYNEAAYLSRRIKDQLASASPAARRAALHSLVGELGPDDLDDVTRFANRIKRARRDGD
jgi:BlaI family transcriptional regulator, penicillinase repressor